MPLLSFGSSPFTIRRPAVPSHEHCSADLAPTQPEIDSHIEEPISKAKIQILTKIPHFKAIRTSNLKITMPGKPLMISEPITHRPIRHSQSRASTLQTLDVSHHFQATSRGSPLRMEQQHYKKTQPLMKFDTDHRSNIFSMLDSVLGTSKASQGPTTDSFIPSTPSHDTSSRFLEHEVSNPMATTPRQILNQILLPSEEDVQYDEIDSLPDVP